MVKEKINSSKFVLNGTKLMWHVSELKKWYGGEDFPCIYIEFGPTSACNHKCKHCYVQEIVKKPLSIKKEIYLRFMEEIGIGVKAIVLGGCGEPFLHTTSVKAIETAVINGVDVGVLTNGTLIKEKDIPSLMKNLTFIRFSVNGGSAKSYSNIHQCPSEDYFKVKKIIKKCVEYRDKHSTECTIGVYTLISEVNIHEMINWTREVKKMGADYIIIKPPEPALDGKIFVKQADLEKVRPLLKKLEKLEEDSFKVMVRTDMFEEKGYCKRDYKQCLGLPFICMVDSDGSVYTCNWYWGNKNFCYGNLYENTFSEIWNGKLKKEIMKRVSSPKFNLDKCGRCRQDNLNKFLWNIKNNKIKIKKPDGEPPPHINFI